MKRYFILVLTILIFFTGCSGKDDDYIDEKVRPEVTKEIKEELAKMDEKTADIVEKIYMAHSDKARYYETKDIDNIYDIISLNVEFDNKKVVYTKDIHYDGDVRELVSIFERENALFINIAEEMFFRKDVPNRKSYNHNDLKYPDHSNLHTKLYNNTIVEIKEEDGNTRLDFSDGTYSIYNKDYLVIEDTQNVEGTTFTTRLLKEENPKDVYDTYKSLIKDYLEEDSLANINWYPDREYENGNLVRKHPREKP